MSIIDEFVRELDNTFEGINDSNIVSNYNKDKYQSVIDEGNEIIDQLKIEIHNITNQQHKASIQAKIIHYKDIISKLQKQILLNNKASSNNNKSTSNNEAIQKSENGLDILKQARQQIADTENVAVDTMEHLTKQREQIQKTTDNTKKINAELGYSNKLLGKMSQWWR